jgi:hypothetical protein
MAKVYAVVNLFHAVSPHFMYYNFTMIHRTLRVTQATKTGGLSDQIWTLEETE